MREREDRTLPFAFRSEEMSLPTIRKHVAPNSTIGRGYGRTTQSQIGWPLRSDG
jgi:hypothetical protein